MVRLWLQLSQRSLTGALLKHLSKLQVDEEPAIRTNTTILLGNIARHLNDAVRHAVCSSFDVFCQDSEGEMFRGCVGSLPVRVTGEVMWEGRRLYPPTCDPVPGKYYLHHTSLSWEKIHHTIEVCRPLSEHSYGKWALWPMQPTNGDI